MRSGSGVTVNVARYFCRGFLFLLFHFCCIDAPSQPPNEISSLSFLYSLRSGVIPLHTLDPKHRAANSLSNLNETIDASELYHVKPEGALNDILDGNSSRYS
jgi:hypothetical protein